MPSDRKLPAIVASFRIMRVAATSLGETARDRGLGTIGSSAILASILVVFVVLATRQERYARREIR